MAMCMAGAPGLCGSILNPDGPGIFITRITFMLEMGMTDTHKRCRESMVSMQLRYLDTEGPGLEVACSFRRPRKTSDALEEQPEDGIKNMPS